VGRPLLPEKPLVSVARARVSAWTSLFHGAPMTASRHTPFALLALLFAATTADAHLTVTGCGQVVPAHKIAVLTSDLDCASGPGVILDNGARAKLEGFTPSGSPDAANIECLG